MFLLTIISSNSGYCQLSKYPSLDEHNFQALLVLTFAFICLYPVLQADYISVVLQVTCRDSEVFVQKGSYSAH